MRTWRRTHWLGLAIGIALVLIVLISVGCAGSAAGSFGRLLDTVNPPVTSLGAEPTPTAGLPAPQIGDADAIVAAQEEVLNRIYETTLPSVVHIRVVQKVEVPQAREFELPDIPGFPPFPFESLPPMPHEFFRSGEGSGFVWDDQGHIVTNNHVVEGAERVEVIFWDGTIVDAKVLGTDPDSDLAVLKVDLPPEKLRPASLGDSATLKVGQLVVAIGNPFGQEFTMTSGIISALGRTIRPGTSPFSIPEVIQTDAAINPGNSGGPLLDRQGRVIGINTMIISPGGASAGIGFAIPIDIAKKVVPALIEEGSYAYAWLGIQGTTLTPEMARLMDLPENTRGALVIEVMKDSPADKAGLRGSDRTMEVKGRRYRLGGDVIVGINGDPIKEMDDLVVYLIKNTRPGDTVILELIREDGRREKIEVKLGQRPRTMEPILRRQRRDER
jgi:2-alkenal reductase